MAKVKLNIRGFSVPEFIQYGRRIVKAMTGNSNFTKPQPPLADITGSVDNLEQKYNDVKAARMTAMEKTTIQNNAEDDLAKELSRLGSYVENESDADEIKILSAGMDVKDEPSPIGDLPQVDDLSATIGDKAGEIDLDWDNIRGAGSYTIEMSIDKPGDWKHAGVATKSKFTVTGLESGKQYWFRVAAVGSAGQGPWSDPATKYVV